MNARPTAHPSVEVLRAYVQGRTGVVPADVVAAHLAACPDCRRTAECLKPESAPTASMPARDPRAATQPSLPGVPPELSRHPEYEVQRKLGEGGMGAVYLARNRLMDRLEVLKVVNQSLLGRAGAAERFLQEIRSAAKLQHPNVVTAYAASR
jgi:serine/threonine protein kinase